MIIKNSFNSLCPLRWITFENNDIKIDNEIINEEAKITGITEETLILIDKYDDCFALNSVVFDWFECDTGNFLTLFSTNATKTTIKKNASK